MVFSKERNLFSQHNYVVIDPVAYPDVPDDLPLLSLAPPVLQPQAHLYPYLLPIAEMDFTQWQELSKQVNQQVKEGVPPLFSLLLKSEFPAQALKNSLGNCLLLKENDGVNRILRFYDPRILFHLLWMYSPAELTHFYYKSGVTDWTFLVEGQWQSFNMQDVEPTQRLSGKRSLADFNKITLINRLLKQLSIFDLVDVTVRTTISHKIFVTLTHATEVYHFQKEDELMLFVYHVMTVDDDIEQHPIMRRILIQCQQGQSYSALTQKLTDSDWQKIKDNLCLARSKGTTAIELARTNAALKGQRYE